MGYVASLPVVNQGPQSGPLTPLYNGDLVQTPKGLRSLALEGFSEDLDQDGYVDPIADAVAQVGYAGVQPAAAVHHVVAEAPVAAAAAVAPAAVAPAISVDAARFAPVYNNLAAYGLTATNAGVVAAAPAVAAAQTAVAYNGLTAAGLQYVNGYNGYALPATTLNALPAAAATVNALPAVNTVPATAAVHAQPLLAAAAPCVNVYGSAVPCAQ